MEEKTYLGITYQAKNEVNVDELYDKFDGNELVFVSKETYFISQLKLGFFITYTLALALLSFKYFIYSGKLFIVF